MVEFKNYTLSYSEDIEGFPSFYSYEPDFMIGMNNYFYSFKNGNLFRHNVNEVRNNFYGVQYSSTIRSVFNELPLANKLFKTISIDGDDSWGATLFTDIQSSGIIDNSWFEKKEQTYYAFIRNTGTVPADIGEYALRSLNGIGRSIAVDPGGTIIDFNIQYNLRSILSVGDMVYFSDPVGTPPQLAGQIISITSNAQQGVNQVVIDTTIPGTITIPAQDTFFLYIKNAISESHGLLGHYCVFDIENTNTEGINLFSIGSEVMKSYP